MTIEIRGMAPLLPVLDMPTSIAFYRDVPGLRDCQHLWPPGERFDWALLRCAGVELIR